MPTITTSQSSVWAMSVTGSDSNATSPWGGNQHSYSAVGSTAPVSGMSAVSASSCFIPSCLAAFGAQPNIPAAPKRAAAVIDPFRNVRRSIFASSMPCTCVSLMSIPPLLLALRNGRSDHSRFTGLTEAYEEESDASSLALGEIDVSPRFGEKALIRHFNDFDQIIAGMDADLGIDVLYMGAHGILRDHQALSRRGNAPPFAQASKNLGLPIGQLVDIRYG